MISAACGGEPSTDQGSAEASEDVNAALDTMATRIDHTSMTSRSHATLATGSCTEWKQRGDSLHALFTVVNERLERMRSSMDQGPLHDIQVADSVYRANGDGERLYTDLRRFYGLALRSAADTSGLRRTERMATQVLSFPTAEAWRSTCFTRVPRVTCSGILSKIATDALLIESICLHSILKQCERSVGGSPFPENDSTAH